MTKYVCEMIGSSIVYFDENKRLQLKGQDYDCYKCEEEIENVRSKVREEIKKRHIENTV